MDFSLLFQYRIHNNFQAKLADKLFEFTPKKMWKYGTNKNPKN